MNDRCTSDTERRELEIGRATLWADTDLVKFTIHLGTLSTCLLLGYLLGRRRKVRTNTDRSEADR